MASAPASAQGMARTPSACLSTHEPHLVGCLISMLLAVCVFLCFRVSLIYTNMMDEDVDTELIIQLVKERPVLWNKFHEHYKSRSNTTQSWTEVCCQLNQDFENLSNEDKSEYGKLVSKRWKNVKDQYLKSMKKRKEKEMSGLKGKKMKNYVYHKHLSFLKMNMDEREIESNCKDGYNKSFAEWDSKKEDENPTDKSCEADEIGAIQSSALKSSIRRKRVNIERQIPQHSSQEDDDSSEKSCEADEVSAIHSSALKPAIKRTKLNTKRQILQHSSTKVDRHLSFFNCIHPSLKEFTDDETLEFQSGVINLIQNIKKARSNQAQHPNHNFGLSHLRPNTADPAPHSNNPSSGHQESEQTSPNMFE